MSSLCKLYFRELPNPLLTYQLYGKFSVSKGVAKVGGCWDALGPASITTVHNLQEAMSVPGEEERLVRIHDVIQQLPPPHYR